MLNHTDFQQEHNVAFLPCDTPVQAMAGGRAAGEQWRGKPIALARESGPRAGMFSVAAVAGLMAGGAKVLDYGVRLQSEFHYIRDARCPAAFYFRESPGCRVEVYAPEGQPLGEGPRHRLTELAQARQDALPFGDTPGQWLRMDGGRQDYFQKLASLAPQGLEEVCCRFTSPHRETQALGNQVLSVLGVRATGCKFLVLDRLGRLAALQDGGSVMGQARIFELLEKADGERQSGKSRQRWMQDGLMAGILLLALLEHKKEPESMGALDGALVGIPVIRLPAPGISLDR